MNLPYEEFIIQWIYLTEFTNDEFTGYVYVHTHTHTHIYICIYIYIYI